MHLVFVGTGASTSKDRFQSAVYLSSSTAKILFNAPKGIRNNLEKNKLSLKTLDYILINHKHSDAFSGLKELPQTATYLPEEPISLPFRFKAFEVEHAKDCKTHAFAFTLEGLKFFVAIDFKRLPEEVYRLSPDVAILDASFWFGRHLIGHSSIDETLEVIRKLKPSIAYLVQIGVTYPPQKEAEEKIKEYAKALKIKSRVVLTYDGLTSNLDTLKEAKQSLQKYFSSFNISLDNLRIDLNKLQASPKFVSLKVSEEEEIDTRNEVAEKFWKENWFNYYPKIKKPKFIYHHHWRGLLEDELYKGEIELSETEEGWVFWLSKEAASSFTESSLVSFGSEKLKLKEFLERLITDRELLLTNHSLHGDLRFQTSKELLHGWTVFLGKAKDNRFENGDKFLASKTPLQCAVKNIQPVAWIYVAKDKPYISKPKSIGATSLKYAVFYALDSGTYEPMTWHRHFFEYKLNGKKLNGRVFIASAPIEKTRKWLLHRDLSNTYYADVNNLQKVINKLKKKKHQILFWRPSNKQTEIIKIS